ATTIAIVVAPIVVAVPAMVVTEVAARRAPVAFVETAAFPVRLHPVRAGVRRTRPVAVMPIPAIAARIPVAFDPLVIGAGARGHAIRARGRRRRPDRESELPVRLRARRRGEKQETQ